jgi:cyclophilin family peptidyl-prolyl cis-trans isomerase
MNKKLLISCVIIILVGVGIWYAVSRTPEPAETTESQSEVTPVTPSIVEETTDSTSSPQAPITNTKTETKTMTATIKTSMGDITVEFFPNIAPNAVANFEKLAKAGFYDNVKFHRVIKDFMIQAGDPLSKDDNKMAMWGTGGPGYKFADEITAESKNDLGTLAMANSGPNTNGSQFYINAKANNFLDGKYVVFGKVTKGLDIVLAIDNVKTGENDRPVTPVVIKSISLQ